MFLGSHSLSVSTPGPEILDTKRLPPVAGICQIPQFLAIPDFYGV